MTVGLGSVKDQYNLIPVTVHWPPHSVFPLKVKMTFSLLFLLVLLHEHIQLFRPVQADLGLPLAVRSPYLSYWLPQNGSANITDKIHLPPTKSDLDSVCLFVDSV